ncbi:8977_t:CDS:2, partial [Cetraspora pellucida]
QDPLGKSVSIVHRTLFYDIWTGPLSDGYVAVLFNRGEIPQVITLHFASHCNLEGEITVRDLWEHADKGIFTKRVSKHGVTVLKLTGGMPVKKHNESLFLQHVWDDDIVDNQIDVIVNGENLSDLE